MGNIHREMVRPGMSDGRTFDTQPYKSPDKQTSEWIKSNADKQLQLNYERLVVEQVLPSPCANLKSEKS